mmetsp:Transcript_16822/g.65743  ORF Transcript_16822/g.65743 Transcript_16822/m.65743 type:complete len:189 (-) Transcript_16822:27-593(-)
MPMLPEETLAALPPHVRQMVTRVVAEPVFTFRGEEFWLTDPDLYMAAAHGYYVVKAVLRFLSPLHTMAKSMGGTSAMFAGNELGAGLYGQREAAAALQSAGVLLVCTLWRDQELLRYVAGVQAVRCALNTVVRARQLMSDQTSMFCLAMMLFSAWSAYSLGRTFVYGKKARKRRGKALPARQAYIEEL